MAGTLLIPSAAEWARQTMQLREALEQAVAPLNLQKTRAASNLLRDRAGHVIEP